LPSIIDKVLSDLQTQADTDRQDSQADRLSMYLDDYSNQIIYTLQQQFHRDNYNRLYPLLATYYNLLKKIVNLKSVIYKSEAKRYWYKRDGKSVDENYSEIISRSNLDLVMPTTNKLVEVNNTCFPRIMATEQGAIKYEAVPSENISIIQSIDDPETITHLLHRVTIKDSNNSITEPLKMSRNDTYTVKYFYWDEENYAVLDSNKSVLPGYPLENPYKDPKTGRGIIPYVLFSNFPSIAGDIWHETQNSDLYNGTIQVNVFQTYLNNLMKQSGYRQPFMTGVDKDEAAKMDGRVSDSLQPIVITDPNANIGAFELSGDITKVMDAIHDIISEIADNHGVEFSSRTSSAQKMSGLALSISQEALNNLKEEQQPYYRKAESELAYKTAIIANTDLKANIDLEGRFSIDFFEEKRDESVDDQIKKAEYQLNNNLVSLTDLYRQVDPDCPTDEEAIKRLQENKAINDQLRAEDIFAFTPEVDSAEEDDSKPTG